MNKNESKYYNTALLMDEALIQLLEKKDYEFITVKEICRKAGVNRSTFYLHYENVDDLLQETIETINRRFYDGFDKQSLYVSDIKNADKIGSFLITPKYLEPYLNFVKENKKLYRLIHSKPSVFQSEQAFLKMYREIFQPILDKFEIPKETQTYVFAYYFQGLLAMIMRWVENDCDMPVDKFIALITDIMSFKID